MELKDYLRIYREEHGLSQRQFAERCGLSNGYISMLERGVNPKTNLPVTPTLPALKKMATGMGIDLATLLTEVDDMPVELSVEDKKPATHEDDGLSEIVDIFKKLSPDNRSKLLELSRLYLNAQSNNE